MKMSKFVLIMAAGLLVSGPALANGLVVDHGWHSGNNGARTAVKRPVPPQLPQGQTKQPHDSRIYPGANSFIDDFRVNDENYRECFEHYQASLAASFWPMTVWVAWFDGRSCNGDIYLQRYNSTMAAAGSNIRVNDDSTAQISQYYPQVACDSAGNALVVWYDGRWPRAYGQRFDNTGARIGVNFPVFSDTMNAYGTYPSVGMTPGGAFAVCSRCYQYTFGRLVIAAQRYDNAGAQVGPPIYVDTLNSDKLYYASCGMSNNRMVFAWYDNRNANWDMYARVYDGSGNPVSGAIRVTEPAAVTDPYTRPALAVGDSGQFALAWYDNRNGNYDVFVQRYDCNGTPAGANTKANQDAGTAGQYYPQVNYILRGDAKDWLIITWLDSRSGWTLYYQQINPAGSLTGEGQYIPGTEDPGNMHGAGVCYTGSDYLLPVAWDDARTGNEDVYCLERNNSTTSAKCNRDSLGAYQYTPTAAADSTGAFMVAWNDQRRAGSHANGLIYARNYQAAGTPVTAFDVLLSDTAINYVSENPALAANAAGDFICLWDEYSTITGQTGTISGGPAGSNFRITADTTHYWSKYGPAVAIDDSARFLAAWRDNRENNFDLYCRGFKSGGVPLISYDVRINPANGSSTLYKPWVADLRGGRFAVVWNDTTDNQTIYAQLVELGGDTLTLSGVPFPVSDEPAGIGCAYFNVAAAANGDFCVVWYDVRVYNLMARWFNRDGVAYGAGFAVSPDNTYPQLPAIAIDQSGRIAITWFQTSSSDDSYDVMARVYKPDHSPYTDVFQVNTGYGVNRTQQNAAAAIGGGHVYFAWEDCRYDTCGTDIFAKGYSWAELGVFGKPEYRISNTEFRLEPNRPNPFSQWTAISYQLPAAGRSSIKIYNIAGQLVRTLADGKQAAGAHTVRWDGRNDGGRTVVGGVYLVRLRTDAGSITRKLTLVK